MELEAAGHQVKSLEEKTELYNDLVSDYQAFAVLSTSRPAGMSISFIPLYEIFAYMQIFEISDYDQRKRFLRHIKILDTVYIEYMHNQES